MLHLSLSVFHTSSLFTHELGSIDGKAMHGNSKVQGKGIAEFAMKL